MDKAARRKAGGYSLGIWMRGLLRSLAAEGRAVLVSSHLMSELEGTADHLVIAGRGRVLADTPTRDLYLFPILTQAVGSPGVARHLQQIGPMTAGLEIQASTGLANLPIGPWAGLGVLAAWEAAALLAGAVVLRVRDA